LTDLSGHTQKPTANGDTRPGLRHRIRTTAPSQTPDTDPPQHPTSGKFNSRSLIASSRHILADPQTHLARTWPRHFRPQPTHRHPPSKLPIQAGKNELRVWAPRTEGAREARGQVAGVEHAHHRSSRQEWRGWGGLLLTPERELRCPGVGVSSGPAHAASPPAAGSGCQPGWPGTRRGAEPGTRRSRRGRSGRRGGSSWSARRGTARARGPAGSPAEAPLDGPRRHNGGLARSWSRPRRPTPGRIGRRPGREARSGCVPRCRPQPVRSRLWTPFHDPKCSGRSIHGVPVRYLNAIASITCR
jgi:hypothetical protein